MATASLAVLAVLSLGVLVLSVGLYAHVGASQLHTSAAIAHDGPRPGSRAPALDVPASHGGRLVVPAGVRQVLLFADHSLIEFPELLAPLTGQPADLPPVAVLGSSDRTSSDLIAGLGLTVPYAVVPHAIYHRYRIRVMPYAVVIESAGRVVTSGLVNTLHQLDHLARVGVKSEPAR
jgi:hypothetical protein